MVSISNRDLEVSPEELESIEPIGSGSFGEVWKGRWIGKGGGVAVAIKKVQVTGSTEENQRKVLVEVDILMKLKHPNIMTIYGACVVQKTELWIVMEYMEGGSLYEVLHSDVELPWDLRLRLAHQAAICINVLHSSSPSVLHRDVKSPNFMLSADWTTLKLIDFGTSKLSSHASAAPREALGSSRWRAPETFCYPPAWTTQADIYSLGMTLYEIASRRIPFDDILDNDCVINIVVQGTRPQISDMGSPQEFSKIIINCWDKAPANRPTSVQLVKELATLIARLPLPDNHDTAPASRNRSPTAVISTTAKVVPTSISTATPTSPTASPSSTLIPPAPLPHKISLPSPWTSTLSSSSMYLTFPCSTPTLPANSMGISTTYPPPPPPPPRSTLASARYFKRRGISCQFVSLESEALLSSLNAELDNARSYRLAFVILINCNFDTISMSLLISLLERCTITLEEFRLYDCTGYIIHNITQVLKGCPKLRNLFIRGTNESEAKEIASLCLTLPNCLRDLSMHAHSATSAMLPSYVPVIKQCASLRKLELIWDEAETQSEHVQLIFQALKKNVSITALIVRGGVDEKFFQECFEENRTIVDSYPFPRYGLLNKISKELGIITPWRSVPLGLQSEGDLRQFLADLSQQAEKWNALKLVVLGHGEVGKTTLIHAAKQYLNASKFSQVVKNVKPPSREIGRERTVGVDLSTISIADGEVSVWDFGGQLEYAVTHQLLLSVEMVIYVVCYDLSASQELQIEQRAYWLNFLQSTLPSNPDSRSKWRVIVVGTKSDESHSKNLADAVLSWQQKWPNIPFHHQHFAVSSFKMDGVQALTKALQQVCATIFGQHTILIPKTYKALLESIQTIPLDKCIVQISQLKAAHWIGSDNQFSAAMRYLHSVGYIILLGSSLVCTCPQILPKITSEFISPEAVRNKLTENYNVQILDEEQIGVVLNIGKETIGLRDKLALLQHVKVCFKLVGLQDENPMYLFPSLGTFSDKLALQVAHPKNFDYAGLRVTAPPNQIFTSLFFCQLVVAIFAVLNIARRELVAVHSNGIIVSCKGMFLGQLLVKMSRQLNSLVVLQSALMPDLAFITSAIRELIKLNFYQYEGFKEEVLCPACVKRFPYTEQFGTITEGDQMCSLFKHETSFLRCASRQPDAIAKDPLLLGHKCKSHDRDQHHFFLNYHPLFDGIKHPYSTERGRGLVEVIYEKLAPSKLNGEDIFIFWDKKCLLDGQTWEKGFLHGITNSTAIILLITERVVEEIIKTAPTGQHDMLVEYECALLKNKTHGTLVIPVFAAEITRSSSFIAFNIGKMVAALPNVRHARQPRATRTILDFSTSLAPEETEFLSSISLTMNAIFDLSGLFLNHRGEDKVELEDFVERAMQAMAKWS